MFIYAHVHSEGLYSIYTYMFTVNVYIHTCSCFQVMDRDAKLMRQDGPTIFAQARHMKSIPEIASLILAAYREATGKR